MFFLYTAICEDVHPRRPGLMRIAHRLTCSPMTPLIEFPILIHPQTVDLGQFLQLAAGFIFAPGLDQRGHIETTHKRPDTAIVVLFRQVQVVVAVILAPVLVAGMDDRMQHPHRIRIGDTHLAQVIQDTFFLRRVSDAKQDRQ